MLESLTIFSKGGLILYQYLSDPSLMEKSAGKAAPGFTTSALNQTLIAKFLLEPTGGGASQKQFHIAEGTTFVWADVDAETCIVALYPDILFEGPRQYLREWATSLVEQAAREYQLYAQSSASATTASSNQVRPDPAPFDKTFRALLNQSKTKQQQQQPQHTTNPHVPSAESSSSAASASSSLSKTTPSTTTKKSKKPGKEKRTWGEAKVTDAAMRELDMSQPDDDDDAAAGAERALQEARAAYLPTTRDLQEQSSSSSPSSSSSSEPSWSSTAVGWFQQMTGNKVLEASDLEKPLEEMQNFLTSQNVAAEIAQHLCQAVARKLTGKKLNSLYRVQTAVQQALETAITKLLHHDVDLLRNVLSKRGDSLLFSSSSKKKPYVVAVVGINGVGKSTSLAKLAYYFRENGCKPLLVAGDTFRSGAVEQLKVHADCLQLPVFSQGYSKDPSSVAKAAIEHATTAGNDVVLIDTAGRMQNNVPLMKALGKLATENRPDFVILVAEALVGHDGLSQYRMFSQALGRRGIDGLLVTKFDTVSTKVGASLTLTHETGVPIVFCGTGQKYHHLKKLNAAEIVRTLFS